MEPAAEYVRNFRQGISKLKRVKGHSIKRVLIGYAKSRERPQREFQGGKDE